MHHIIWKIGSKFTYVVSIFEIRHIIFSSLHLEPLRLVNDQDVGTDLISEDVFGGLRVTKIIKAYFFRFMIYDICNLPMFNLILTTDHGYANNCK